MSSEEAEITAERELNRLLREGKAQDVLDTYYTCRQSCEYVYSIVEMCANSKELQNEAVRNFCKNLLDDWSK